MPAKLSSPAVVTAVQILNRFSSAAEENFAEITPIEPVTVEGWAKILLHAIGMKYLFHSLRSTV